MKIKVKDSELKLISDILKHGAVCVQNTSNPNTFYVRFRMVLQEKGIGTFIKGASTPNGVYFWLLVKMPYPALMEEVKEAACNIDWKQYQPDVETSKVILQIKEAIGESPLQPWADKIQATKLPLAIVSLLCHKLHEVCLNNAPEDIYLSIIQNLPQKEELTFILKEAQDGCKVL